jgi:hypothetical protein
MSKIKSTETSSTFEAPLFLRPEDSGDLSNELESPQITFQSERYITEIKQLVIKIVNLDSNYIAKVDYLGKLKLGDLENLYLEKIKEINRLETRIKTKKSWIDQIISVENQIFNYTCWDISFGYSEAELNDRPPMTTPVQYLQKLSVSELEEFYAKSVDELKVLHINYKRNSLN